MYALVNPSFTIQKVGFKGVNIIKVCFRDVDRKTSTQKCIFLDKVSYICSANGVMACKSEAECVCRSLKGNGYIFREGDVF